MEEKKRKPFDFSKNALEEDEEEGGSEIDEEELIDEDDNQPEDYDEYD